MNEWGKPTKKYYILRDLLTKMVPQFGKDVVNVQGKSFSISY